MTRRVMHVLQASAEITSVLIHKEMFHMTYMPSAAGVHAVLQRQSLFQMTQDNFVNSELI